MNANICNYRKFRHGDRKAKITSKSGHNKVTQAIRHVLVCLLEETGLKHFETKEEACSFF